MALKSPDNNTENKVRYHILNHESELLAAILRAIFIILAAVTLIISDASNAGDIIRYISVSGLFVFNLFYIVMLINEVRLPDNRLYIIIVDVLLISSWVYSTWSINPGEIGSPLFAMYFVVLLFSAIWFGILGTLTTAFAIAGIYMAISFFASGSNPYILLDIIFRHILYLLLVAVSAGYMVETHKRDRKQSARTQALVSQYEERFRAAQEVYEMLIPANAPQITGLELAARWRPALREGGGDFYDVIKINDQRVVITIADVAGKHSRGASKLPLFKAAFQACSQVWSDPADILQHVNGIVYPLLQPDMFISSSVVVIDLQQHTLAYSNAGHNPPVMIRGGDNSTVELNSGGILLGVNEVSNYPTETIPLKSGDLLCLYTDGITETQNPEGNQFGYENLAARIKSAVALKMPAEAIAENIYEAVSSHLNGGMRKDDLTLLIMRYSPEELALVSDINQAESTPHATTRTL